MLVVVFKHSPTLKEVSSLNVYSTDVYILVEFSCYSLKVAARLVRKCLYCL